MHAIVGKGYPQTPRLETTLGPFARVEALHNSHHRTAILLTYQLKWLDLSLWSPRESWAEDFVVSTSISSTFESAALSRSSFIHSRRQHGPHVAFRPSRDPQD